MFLSRPSVSQFVCLSVSPLVLLFFVNETHPNIYAYINIEFRFPNYFWLLMSAIQDLVL